MNLFKKPTIAFCFTGGGSRGAVQVGMLKEFTLNNIIPVAVSGSSVGALNAAYFAANPNYEGVLELEKIWLSLSEEEIFPSNSGDLVKGILSRNFTMPNTGIKTLISNLKLEFIENSKIPLYINTTLLKNGMSVIHQSGELKDILLASSAIPGLFPPVELNQELHIDGGVSSVAPINPLTMHRPKTIYVLDSTGPSHIPKQKTALDILKTGFSYSTRSQILSLESIEKVKVLSLPSFNYTKDSRNFENTAKLISAGQMIVREYIQGSKNE